MKTNQEKREDIALRVERYFIRAAHCVRDRIRAGDDVSKATQHESAQYWVDLIEKADAELSALE